MHQPFGIAGNSGQQRIKEIDMADRQEVVVIDIRMGFGSMVVFMVKWALASIPAVFILAAIFYVVVALFHGATLIHT